jgi:hypothetical protein
MRDAQVAKAMPFIAKMTKTALRAARRRSVLRVGCWVTGTARSEGLVGGRCGRNDSTESIR